MKGFTDNFLFILVVIWIIISIFELVPYDSTDNEAKEQRSGMGIHIDHSTGCQYLSRVTGLTPRLDPDGKQICVGEE